MQSKDAHACCVCVEESIICTSDYAHGSRINASCVHMSCMLMSLMFCAHSGFVVSDLQKHVQSGCYHTHV